MPHHKNENSNLSIIDAIEALSGIADMDLEHEGRITLPQPPLEVEGQIITSKNIDWLQTESLDSAIDRVKEIFHVILNYLRNCYKRESSYLTSQKTIEGIKAIMVLVGDAAKKLDKYTAIMDEKHTNQVITQLREYKQLQEFYQKKVDHKIDESLLSRWILGLRSASVLAAVEEERVKERKIVSTKHMFVDLESVKSDADYELLLMRKEEGTRFINPRLLRNLKLVCEFGGALNTPEQVDPLGHIGQWQNRVCCTSAQNILVSLGGILAEFYHESMSHKDNELVECLNKAAMALMLAGNPRHLQESPLHKSSINYFSDFQFYLRAALRCRDYEKLLAYTAVKQENLSRILLDFTHSLCRSLYLSLQGMQELLPHVDHLLHEARQQSKKELLNTEEGAGISLWNRLAYDYEAFLKVLKLHPNGPLLKIMDLLEKGETAAFDSIIQGNLPNYWFDLYLDESKMTHIRLPSPTRQAVIDKAVVTEEFKGMLYSFAQSESPKHHLLFSLQDRTSWREFSRTQALEHLQLNPVFGSQIHVVTLAIDTDFYLQNGIYEDLKEASSFIKQFKEHLSDEASGFYFPLEIKEPLFSSFIDPALEAVHRFCFDSKKNLSQNERLEFITFFYMLLELKILEMVHPDSFSLTCKDSIDVGPSASALLFAFLKLASREVLSEADIEYLNLIIYGPALLIRERAMLGTIFDRMVGTLKMIDLIRQREGHKNFVAQLQETFGPLFETPIFKAQIAIPTTPEDMRWKLAA